MTGMDWIQVIFCLSFLVIISPFLGSYFAKVYRDESHFLKSSLSGLEKVFRAIVGRTAYEAEMDWKAYTKALLLFNALGFGFTMALQVFQGSLPLNPQGLPGVSWHLALNTAISFVTNTNWQSYAGETSLSYFVQMMGLTVQNFVSAATGMAVAVALARGMVKKQTPTLGNFWSDLVRGTVYILLPFSLLLSTVLISEGVVQNLSPAVEVATLERAKQIIPMGPAASQVAIKQLGTNGGGYYNANSAHPLENPTPFSNLLQLLSILLIPCGFAFMWGRLVNQRRQGVVIFTSMFVLLLAGLGLSLWAEYQPNALYPGVHSWMEGKEVRFGVTNSVLWSTFTTAASNGSVNAMHSSLSPLAGAVAMFNMMIGEIVFGGVGSGLYGMILFVILTVFLAGLMVGRTPEYLGKKIESRDIQMAWLGILLPSAAVLIGAGISVILPTALASLSAKGPHGLSEILYAFVSAANNNGSAFAGLNANVPYYNVMLGIAMLIGRFGVIIPVLVIAGNMGKKRISPPGVGTFTTDNGMFVGLLIAVIVVVGGLTFFPALCLGPIVEHLLLNTGKTF
jgi:potassium-transporting ATPase potassium-binding subunit